MINPHVAQHKILRGEILRALYRNLPHPVGDNLLASIFTTETLSNLQGNLRYLGDKGYIELEEVSEPYVTATLMARLTSKGVDLLEGSIQPDPGIVTPPL